MVQETCIHPNEKLCSIIEKLLNMPLDNWKYDVVHNTENIISFYYQKPDQEDKIVMLQAVYDIKEHPIIRVYFWNVKKHTRTTVYYNPEQEVIYNDLLNFIYNLIHLKNINNSIAYNTVICKELETYF